MPVLWIDPISFALALLGSFIAFALGNELRLHHSKNQRDATSYGAAATAGGIAGLFFTWYSPYYFIFMWLLVVVMGWYSPIIDSMGILLAHQVLRNLDWGMELISKLRTAVTGFIVGWATGSSAESVST